MKLDHYKNKYYEEYTVFGTHCPFTPEEGLQKIHVLCGCNGVFDCDCVSVMNKAKVELWSEKNNP